MKTINRLSFSLLGFVSAFSLASAEQPPVRISEDGKEPGRKFERRTVVRYDNDERPKEPVTFLGVETGPVSSTLTAQLDLPKGTGLVVSHVLPDSPAAATLKSDDILLKLDDQILIASRQFSVLVRNHKEGDEVTLTYVRGGKPATAKVKLAKRDLPNMTLFKKMDLDDGNAGFSIGGAERGPGPGHEEMDHMLSLVGRGPGGETRHLPGRPPGNMGFRAINVNPGNSNMVYSDEQGSLDLTIRDGGKTLVAKDTKGAQVFSGPVNTPEERKTLPPAVRERLDRIEGMEEFSFRTDGEFQDHLKILQPEPTKIMRSFPMEEQSDRMDSSGPL